MLKQIREQNNLSQSQLANKSKVNVRMIQYYEQGVRDINNAHLSTLVDLALALDCTIQDLLTDKDLIERVNCSV